jgi:uncharacterized protein
MPTIVHFEIPSDNLERTRKFYSELFGWKMEKMHGMGQVEYWAFSTSSRDKGSGDDITSNDSEQRTISGGMMER